MTFTLPHPTLEAGLLDSFQRGLDDTRPHTGRFSAKSAATPIANAREVDDVDSAQRVLRPLFGKGLPQSPAIGDHPDFCHLKGTEEIC